MHKINEKEPVSDKVNSITINYQKRVLIMAALFFKSHFVSN